MVGLNLQPPTGQIQKLVSLTLHKPSYVGQPVGGNKPKQKKESAAKKNILDLQKKYGEFYEKDDVFKFNIYNPFQWHLSDSKR